ncbi:ATPase associated with various cellular activities (AAA) family protein [Leishmania donovani]|uniref:ATPase associated with various cellular activities (AAA) family protein n=1 Tax=Leishmania donovani TaxID=5661 RepID=A0A504Y0C8_LEIDO|nr:ATPase associated with various cellular activities (AAA) family protein [Leishmania donovani]
MQASVASEIVKAVHKARNCALYCDYKTALQYYSSIRNEINLHTRSIDDVLCSQWMSLLGELESEAQIIRDTQAELHLFIDPNAAKRREPPDCDENRSSSSAEKAVVPRTGTKKKPRIGASLANSGGSNISVQNAKLYGDKDRFGPAEGPQIPPATRQPARSAASSYAAVSPPFSSSGVGVGRPVAAAPGVGFRQGAGASSGTGAAARGRVKGKSAATRFAGRAGEEELVQLIEADMHVGKLPVTWDDIAGLEEAKRLLEEAVVYPVLMPDYYQGIRRPWKGVLMYGPPGTGKTMLAKAVASECNTTFFNISPATLTSKWRGDSEKLIRIVMVLGATNHPWDIDEAMRRRLEKRIYIPLPDAADRVELFKINTKSIKLGSDVDFVKLSQLLEGRHYSGADITNLVRDAAMMTMRRFMKEADKTTLKENAAEIGRQVAEQPINMSDFLAAMKKVPSSINADNIKKFEAWKKEFELNI